MTQGNRSLDLRGTLVRLHACEVCVCEKVMFVWLCGTDCARGYRVGDSEYTSCGVRAGQDSKALQSHSEWVTLFPQNSSLQLYIGSWFVCLGLLWSAPYSGTKSACRIKQINLTMHHSFPFWPHLHPQFHVWMQPKDRGCCMLYRLWSPLRQIGICNIGLYKENWPESTWDLCENSW